MSAQAIHLPVVAVLDAEHAPPWPGLEPLAEHAEVVHCADAGALEEVMQRAEVLLVTDFRATIIKTAWPDAKRLSWVHATSAGVDMLMFPELVASAIPVTNARGVFDRTIAEYVLGIVAAFAKDFWRTRALQQQQRWQHRDTERIAGARMLVVGAGSIGREIARLARAVGMQVSGLARQARDDDPVFGEVYAAEELARVLPLADYVVIAAPLTEATRHLFDAAALALMKPTARLINIGRGPIVDTDALVAALRANRLAGAALDVFEEEPLPASHPLWAMEQVLISPHMAGDFAGWREALSAQFIANFHRWRAGQPLVNLVDKRRGYAGPAKESA